MAWAGPTLLGSGSGAVGALTQTITGITAAIGDLVIVSGAAFTATAATSITVTDSAGNAYTPCVRTKTASGNINDWIFFSVLTATLSAGTISATGTNNLIDWRLGAASFTGQAASPEDTACRNNANATSASPTVTSGSPSVSGNLMIASVAGNNATTNTFTEDAAWTSLYNGSTPTVAPWGFAYQINAGSGTKTYNPTFGTSVNNTAIITAFKANTGGGGFFARDYYDMIGRVA